MHKIILVYILLGIDDGRRVVLKSISDGVDCDHDYINATYIDVRLVENDDVNTSKYIHCRCLVDKKQLFTYFEIA